MRFFTTRLHGMLDYLVGLLLIAAPWVLGFYAGGAETWVTVAIGAIIVGYSLVTDYELAFQRRLQVPLHLWLDGLIGVLLAVSPWLFAFDQRVWAPHVILGLLLAFAAFLTQTIPGYERRGARSPAG
jgi:hypothetical protein